MKKALFIDRDGTLIVEPPENKQVDAYEKLQFIPGVITWLGKIARELDYEFVLVSNQDGLGTKSFPEHLFWGPHNLMINILAGEGIVFDDIRIDRTFEDEQAPTRKPGTKMLNRYFQDDFDLGRSYVIGDRLSDIELARNLGANGILFCSNGPRPAISQGTTLFANSWESIYHILTQPSRSSEIHRVTSETSVDIVIDLDGSGVGKIDTGIGFFDHMLLQVAKHSGMDLNISVRGDLQIDEHHTIEDTAIAFGEGFARALGGKEGIERFGFTVPMDDALAMVALDLSGRSWLEWDAEFRRERIGTMPTEMFSHFFRSFCDAAHCTIHIKATGANEHHKIEAIFKAFARAIRTAIRRDNSNRSIPSTKGVL